jgi:ferredoxin-NADP reductase
VSLSQALGNFVLPDPLPRSLLFIGGGSGITPILSMVRHLAATGYDGAVAWMHYARREMMFHDEIGRLLEGPLRMRLALTRTRAESGCVAAAPFSLGPLEAFEPAWSSCDTFVCGPEALSRTAVELWGTRSRGDRLHIERFSPQAMPAPPQPTAAGTCRLTFSRSRCVFEGRPGISLLDQAKRAGLTPPQGCRMGICHSCTCRKVSGIVRNETTGQSSGEVDEEIRLCVSTPVTDVTIDL